eukprot:CAMPEP_0203669204 /NCGR_PEP_ID=MMETSP0090-20130426/5640_1 /ASSEMBLY_ACC=CAM_ASM_001088 /TAXON_ID=426623 /ORGANISM="Chaetoceros affinis, Strain CCMP159" /LENGTH=128 /DNA_ID=CAMNT_0050533825 /DNA_START=58 /DNA_END=441 /DNA_ORIENTATION=+
MTMRTLLPSSLVGKVKTKMKRKMKSKKFIFTSLILVAAYSAVWQRHLEKRARQLVEEWDRIRELETLDKGGGDCDIGSPFEDAPNSPTPNTTTTLVTSYPGSGKRFTWAVIKALTNYEVADDWNFSDK